jgi:phosphate transport system substrate-binding protein
MGVMGLMLTGCVTARPPAATVALAGAQIPVELVESWLHDAKSRAFAVTQVSPVYMSQHGFENLARGECDLACTDRDITPRELEKFGARKLAGRRVAFYGYALYVHPSNPLDAIFSRHVRLIFQKRIKDWSELAGAQIPQLQGPISLYGPGKSTRAGMVLSPIANIWFGNPTWEVLDSDADVIAKVAQDPLGLGFASIGYDEGVRYLGLRLERQSPPSFPSLEEIESERYGLAKLIYLYYVEPPSPAVQAVLSYLFSDEGRAAIEGTDLWSIPPDRAVVSPPQ